MNILLMGFSTTGKSSILKEIKKEISSEIKLIDSDHEISKDYDHHIYNLFVNNYDSEDPKYRRGIMEEIAYNENLLIKTLKEIPDPYIAALGPNAYKK